MPHDPSTPEPFIPAHLRPSETTEPLPESASAASESLAARARAAAGPLLGPGSALDLERIVAHEGDVVGTGIDDELVLLHVGTGHYFSLNRIGSAIWALLDGRRTLENVVDAVAQRYAIAPETAARDVATLVAQLERANLVETARA